MLDTGEHSDLILICADKTPFFVHKAIVCAHSNFFWKACQRDSFRVRSYLLILKGECLSLRIALYLSQA